MKTINESTNIMRYFLFGIIALFAFFFANKDPETTLTKEEHSKESAYNTITGVVMPHETLDSIFQKHNLDMAILPEVVVASKQKHNLSKLMIGNAYSFKLDSSSNTIMEMQYGIDDLSYLNITRQPEGFTAERLTHNMERKAGTFTIEINGNLSSSMPGSHREYSRLALQLADIFSWDIDFSSDIRDGDTLKIIVEELWVGDIFRGFGNILAVEFVNDGRTHTIFGYMHDRKLEYYNKQGKSIRKSLLRSPLKYKYISSYYSKSRLHPILRIRRPHLGIDYVAPTGTPVSSAGDGTVQFSGYKGQNGKMVRIRHNNGYETFYGHLSRIPKGIRKGKKVSQGDIIGYVGSTGLSTGPHLDYRMKANGRFVDPLKASLPDGAPLKKAQMPDFLKLVTAYDSMLESLVLRTTRDGQVVASEEKGRKTG